MIHCSIWYKICVFGSVSALQLYVALNILAHACVSYMESGHISSYGVSHA